MRIDYFTPRKSIKTSVGDFKITVSPRWTKNPSDPVGITVKRFGKVWRFELPNSDVETHFKNWLKTTNKKWIPVSIQLGRNTKPGPLTSVKLTKLTNNYNIFFGEPNSQINKNRFNSNTANAAAIAALAEQIQSPLAQTISKAVLDLKSKESSIGRPPVAGGFDRRLSPNPNAYFSGIRVGRSRPREI